MKRKLLFSALTVLSIWFFVWGIPVDVYENYTTIITIIGGVLTTGLLAVTVFSFLPAPKPEDDLKEDNSGCFIGAGLIGFFFAFSIFMIYRGVGESSDELNDKGVYTTAIIIDGSSYKTRKADFTDLTVQFQLKDGRTQTTEIDVSAAEFSSYAKGQEIPIVYSEEHPTIARILRSDAEIARYSKKEIRPLKLEDLTHIFGLKQPAQIQEYLNSVNQKWEWQRMDSTDVYYNNMKKIAIRISGNELLYMHNNFDPVLFNDELKSGGYKATGGMGSVLYSGTEYSIIKRREENKNSNPDSPGYPFNNYLTVISILKNSK